MSVLFNVCTQNVRVGVVECCKLSLERSLASCFQETTGWVRQVKAERWQGRKNGLVK